MVAWLVAALVAALPAVAQGPAAATSRPAPPIALGSGERIADGVQLFRVDDRGLVEPAAPVVVHLLRLDPSTVELTADLALGDRQGRAPVTQAAVRRQAIAAVNGGFFALDTGDPVGVLRIDGDLVSETTRARAAVAIGHDRHGRPTLLVDRPVVTLDLAIDGARQPVRLAGIDTARSSKGLILYTARYGADTGTAEGSHEWVLARLPGRDRTRFVVRSRSDRGHTPIPRDGAVLSFGGGAPPPSPLDRLTPGRRVRLRERWVPAGGRHADRWREADDVVNGAGVLLQRGRPVADWDAERLAESFLGRHPRTMLGADRAGRIWLVAVDGRQAASVGMTLVELQRFAARLGLVDAINLDGGGSTTMVVGTRVVNRPSDPAGPRPVSDVLLVLPRRGPPPAAPH